MSTNALWPDLTVFVSSPDDDAICMRTERGEVLRVEESVDGGIAGVRAVARHVGVGKPGVLDLGLVKLDAPATLAAVFTRNLCASPAVDYDRAVAKQGRVQLVAVVSKNANLFTPTAEQDLQDVVTAAAREFDVHPGEVLVSFTGVIGVTLPTARVVANMAGAASELSAGGLGDFARAIMTTDRRPKSARINLGDISVCGVAKGAGMIEPNLATMLVYLFTDAKVEKVDLDRILKRAVDRTFNAMSVDTDTSTSDTVALLATGARPLPTNALADFENAVTAVCLRLCRKVAREAEGATKLIQVSVSLDTSSEDARFFAKKVVNSPLVKTAVFGSDPNWGRIVVAIGKPAPGSPLVTIDREQLVIRIMDSVVYEAGRQVETAVSDVGAAMKRANTISIEVVIGRGVYGATVWGCDLTPKYVIENSSYTS